MRLTNISDNSDFIIVNSMSKSSISDAIGEEVDVIHTITNCGKNAAIVRIISKQSNIIYIEDGNTKST